MEAICAILERANRYADHGISWYTLRYVDVAPYPSAVAALHALVEEGWLEVTQKKPLIATASLPLDIHTCTLSVSDTCFDVCSVGHVA
jgi:hypothetical protein